MLRPTARASSRPRPESGSRPGAATGPLLSISGLDVYYGRAHALQGVSLTLSEGVLGIVGRNGMGKTTLCNAITGLVPARGSIRLEGQEILGLSAHQITRRGIAYVPQGRRVWPSLSVDETLRLVASHRREVERVYTLFPRLAERKGNGGGQLSGGEQQMLAIGRALLLEPRLLVMDEPTEGLAPVIVQQVAEALRELAREGRFSVLLIEQNLGVATAVADRIAVMTNGRLGYEMAASALAADRELQERLLGVRSGPEEEDLPQPEEAGPENGEPPRVLRVLRSHAEDEPLAGRTEMPEGTATVRGYTRWNTAAPTVVVTDRPLAASGGAGPASAPGQGLSGSEPPAPSSPSFLSNSVFEFPVSATTAHAAYVAGTFDTKGRELFYLRQCLEKLGLRVVTVDLSTSSRTSTASVHPREVARHHPQGESAVFTGDRGRAVAAMTLAFERFILTRRDLGGLISAGGSGGTTLASAAMRALPVGVPKVMVSTMASGDTRAYVGPSDICMMYSVTDVQGINRISERVLANAAHALAGMMTHPPVVSQSTRPALGLTMFGVTTPCVQAVTKALGDEYDCLVFHATGVGGQSMEKLADSGLLAGVIDISTTEIADEIAGGVLSAGPTRLDVFARHEIPWVGSCGALDMANFGAWETVPEAFRQRRLYRHNPNVTLMRTTAQECRAIGEFLVGKINAMRGPVRFLIPLLGVSAIDREGEPFHDPEADRVLFEVLEKGFRSSPDRRLIQVPHHLNDEAFALAVVNAWREIAPESSTAHPSE